MSDEPLRILSLDGGDLHALSQMKILDEFMHRVQWEKKMEERILPCKYFHLIGGSGTGGVLASFLGVLNLSPEEAAREFVRIYQAVFHCEEDNDDREKRSLRLEAELTGLITRKSLSPEMEFLTSIPQASSQIFICVASTDNMSACKHLRSYNSKERPIGMNLLQAMRAAWASPALFTPVHVGVDHRRHKYVACDYSYNNPTKNVIKEAFEHFGSTRRVACLISIGCGTSSAIRLSDNDLAHRMASDCERVASEVEAQIGGMGIYYRYSDTQNTSDLSDPSEITASVQTYTRQPNTSRRLDDGVKAAEGPGTARTEDFYRSETRTLDDDPGLPPLSAFFVDRQELTVKMNDIFVGRGKTTGRVMVLTGMGGSGKTQVTARFVQNHIGEFEYILFIDASSVTVIRTGLIARVRSVSGIKSIKTVDDALAVLVSPPTPISRNWIIIYDNADDTTIDLAEFIPRCGHGYIIITTRNLGLQLLSPMAHVKVDVMSIDEAVTLLLKAALPTNKEPTLDEIDQAHDIVEQLGCLPIAIVQAGCLIRVRNYRMQEYLTQLKINRGRLLDRPMEATLERGHRGVYAALDVTRPFLSSRALQMLGILSFLHPTGITLSLISWATHLTFSFEPYAFVPREANFKETVGILRSVFSPSDRPTNEDVWELIDELQSYSLVAIMQENQSTTMRFHGLVFSWIQDRLASDESVHFREAAVRVMVCNADERNEDLFAAYLPHVQSLLAHTDDLHLNDQAALMRLLRIHGNANMLVKNWKQIHETVVQEYGEGDLRATEAALCLGDAYWRMGLGVEASKLERKAAKWRREILGDEHPQTLQAIAQQALGLYNRGNFDDAENLQIEVLEARRKSANVDSALRVQAMEDLADTYMEQFRSEEARELLVEALEIRKAMELGNDSSKRRIEELIDHLFEEEEDVLEKVDFDQRFQIYLNEDWRPWKEDAWQFRPEIPSTEELERLNLAANLYEFNGQRKQAMQALHTAFWLKWPNHFISPHDCESCIEELLRLYATFGLGDDMRRLRIWAAESLLKYMGDAPASETTGLLSITEAQIVHLMRMQYTEITPTVTTVVDALSQIYEKAILDAEQTQSFWLIDRKDSDLDLAISTILLPITIRVERMQTETYWLIKELSSYHKHRDWQQSSPILSGLLHLGVSIGKKNNPIERLLFSITQRKKKFCSQFSGVVTLAKALPSPWTTINELFKLYQSKGQRDVATVLQLRLAEMAMKYGPALSEPWASWFRLFALKMMTEAWQEPISLRDQTIINDVDERLAFLGSIISSSGDRSIKPSDMPSPSSDHLDKKTSSALNYLSAQYVNHHIWAKMSIGERPIHEDRGLFPRKDDHRATAMFNLTALKLIEDFKNRNNVQPNIDPEVGDSSHLGSGNQARTEVFYNSTGGLVDISTFKGSKPEFDEDIPEQEWINCWISNLLLHTSEAEYGFLHPKTLRSLDAISWRKR